MRAAAWLLTMPLTACISHSADSLVQRATFDLNCPKDQLRWQRLNSDGTMWGAAGCGQRATYVYQQPDKWIMNARTDSVAPQSGPPGAGSQQGVNQ